MATCNNPTISSSISLYLINSKSKTSAVHSSLTTDWTHLGKSTAPPHPIPAPPPSITDGHFPVNNSNKSTPNEYTSDFCDCFRPSDDDSSGARYPFDLGTLLGGAKMERPKSDTRAFPVLSRRTFVDLMLPWVSLSDLHV